MKKTLKALVLMTFTLLTAAITVFGASASATLPGDVNGDGKVTVVDSIKILQYLANADVECVNSALDANGDNVIDGRDSTAILMNIVGLKKDLNYGDSCEHSLTSHPLAPAACTEPGSIEYVSCEKCNKLFLDNTCTVAITAKYTYIKPSGHVEVVDPYVAPTCGKVGSTEGSHCAVCSTVLTASNEVPATGKHDFSAVGNVWLDNTNYIEPVCSVCGTASGFRAEGGYNQETDTVIFSNCDTNFAFDILCSKNEEYIRENLTIVESMFSDLNGTLLDAFANDYTLSKVSDNLWRVSPTEPYLKRMDYNVLFGEEVKLAHFPSNSLSFRTVGESSDVEVYRNDILFLKTFEEKDPGYYPYTIVFDNEAMEYSLTVSKQGIFTDDLIGKVLCVGDCTNMEVASKLSSNEVDIGKITAIKNTESGTVITLGPVGFTDIYDELDIDLGNQDMMVIEDFTEEEKEVFVLALLSNDSFLSTINTVEMAAADYAATYGAISADINWETEKENIKKALKNSIKIQETVVNGNSGAIINIGIDNYSIDIPIEYKENVTIATVTFTFTLKTEYELYIDGAVSKTNILEYLGEKLDIWHEDTIPAYFHAEINTKNKVTFNFGIKLSSDINNEVIYYVVNHNTGTIHTDFCKHAVKYVGNDSNCYTAQKLEKEFGKDYASKQCNSCKPFSENESFAICLTENYATVHKNTCSHISTINKENLYYTYIRPAEGSKVGNLTYSYCKDCGPGTAEQKTFDDFMEKSLESSDWAASFNNLKDKMAEKLNVKLSAPSSDSAKPIRFWIFELGINLTPVISFNAEASVDFNYVDITKTKYVFNLEYDSSLSQYVIACTQTEEGLSEEEEKEVRHTLDITGKITANAGVRLELSMGPALLRPWFNIQLNTEAGVYARLRGVVHIDFKKKYESYWGGYAKLGLYVEVSFNYTLFSYTPDTEIEILKRQELPLVAFGNEKIYYGYDDYEQEVSIYGKTTTYVLDDSLLKSLYFDLTTMNASDEALTFTPPEGSEYSVKVSVVNEYGKPIDYCNVQQGILYISDSAPEEFTAYLKIAVIDTKPLTLNDLINSGFGDTLGVSYTLPELTVKIIYNACYTSEGLEFALQNNGKSYSVTGIGTCTDTNVIIPMKYLGLPVTNIGDSAFRACTSLTSITIPDSVTSIGDYTFYECSSLTSISIPDSVTSIDYGAFQGCSSLTSINIPDSVTSIGYGAFRDCSSLTSISIPDSVTSIGYNAFYYCTSLTSITIPDSVTSIGDYTFCKCSSLTSINIPDSVTSIGVYTFYECSSLTSINIPDSVTSIGNRAFYGCSSLTSISIPDSVTSIDFGTFQGCSSLTSINIPDSVTSIGKAAFYVCSSLTSISIPDGVTSIGEYAFYDCSDLTSVTFEGTIAQWEAISKGNRWKDYAPFTVVHCTDGDVSVS